MLEREVFGVEEDMLADTNALINALAEHEGKSPTAPVDYSQRQLEKARSIVRGEFFGKS